jgi:hypothetical protein
VLLRLSSSALPMLVLLAACVPSAAPIQWTGEGEETTAEASSSSDGNGNTVTTSPPSEPNPSSSGSDEGTSDHPSVFLSEPDGGSSAFECDFLSQDCPPGQKCSVWANDGGGAWNATKCVPIAPDPGEVGEPCTVEGSATSGLDTCELGAMCWDVDPKTNEGTCIAYCQGDASNPYCDDPETTCEGRDILICLPQCCPLEQNCAAGQACYPITDTFSCAPDASGDLGAFGDACEFINVCDPGMLCLDASVLPPGYACEGASGCCTSFCELDSTSCGELDPALECLPWFEEGTAPPGFEHTGACAVPV